MASEMGAFMRNSKNSPTKTVYTIVAASLAIVAIAAIGAALQSHHRVVLRPAERSKVATGLPPARSDANANRDGVTVAMLNRLAGRLESLEKRLPASAVESASVERPKP